MTKVETGGIYRVVGTDLDAPAALVLVTAVDATTSSVTVTLLSPDLELGTSADLTLLGGESGRPYDMLVESDVFGYVWVAQLDRQLGRVDATVLKALSALRDGRAVDRPVAGPPVIERSDPRWGFKLAELRRLRELTSDCTREAVA